MLKGWEEPLPLHIRKAALQDGFFILAIYSYTAVTEIPGSFGDSVSVRRNPVHLAISSRIAFLSQPQTGLKKVLFHFYIVHSTFVAKISLLGLIHVEQPIYDPKRGRYYSQIFLYHQGCT